MAPAKPKVEYTKPTSQLDLEARLGEDAEDEKLGTPLFPLKNPDLDPTEDGDVGTDPVYQNYANETDAPLAAEGGADQLAEEAAQDAYGDAEGVNEAVQKKYDEDVNVHVQGADEPPASVETTSDEK
jgi:hypothetical protein